MKFDTNKVSIIGCGKVGMTAAYALLHTGVVNDLVLVARKKEQAIGEALDLEHGMSFLPFCRVHPSNDYDDVAGSDVVIITAGAPHKPGGTRLDVAQENSEIIEEIILKVVAVAPDAVIIMVSNPVDVLTHKAYLAANLAKGKVFGTGTALDTARFRFHLSEFLHVHPTSIHTFVLGEHGDSSFPVLSTALVGGQPLRSIPHYSEDKATQAFNNTQKAAYKIIESKGATFYGIASVVAQITKNIFLDTKTVMPVSIPLHSYLGISGVSLSLPCVIGRNGVESILEAKLDWEEKKLLERSAAILKEYL